MILSFLRRYWIPVLIVVIIGAFLIGRGTGAPAADAGSQQAAQVLEKVGKLIQLPVGETPQMATIDNAASLKASQPFLANAENGDILIVYAAAQTALLYRPSTDKLIAVGPVNTEPAPKAEVQTKAAATTTKSTQDATTTKAR